MLPRHLLLVCLGTVIAACGTGTAADRPGASASPSPAQAGLPSPAACPAPSTRPAADALPVAEAAAPAGMVEATIPIQAAPGQPQAGFGSIWTSNHRTTTVTRVDPRTDKVVATIDAGVGNGIGNFLVGQRYVWLPVFVHDTDNQLWRLDPTTNTFDRKFTVDDSMGLPVETPSGLWVNIDVQIGSAKRDAVERIDPDTGKVLQHLDVAPAKAGLQYTPVMFYGLGSLWDPIDNRTIARLDPVAGKVLATIELPDAAAGRLEMAFVAGKVFVAMSNSHEVARIDPSTNCMDGLVLLGPGDIGLGAGDASVLYASFDGGALARIDPVTLAVRAVRLDQQDAVEAPFSYQGSVWYATWGDNSLLRLKPI